MNRWPTHRQLASTVLVVALVASSCALRNPLRHRAVVSDAAIFETLKALGDAELTLYRGGLMPQGFGPAEHRAFAERMVKLFEADAALHKVIRTWPQNGPPPAELQLIAKGIDELAGWLLEVLPEGDAKRILGDKVRLARVAIAMLASFFAPVS